MNVSRTQRSEKPVQIDDPALTNLYGQDQSLSLAERHKRTELYIEALNHAL